MDISFVIIGYNEEKHLRACFESIGACDLAGLVHEVIYVDGGSTDGSVAVAQMAGVDLLLGGEKRRRAAENRNLGFRAAGGTFVQFVDGDMVLDATWPKAALAALTANPAMAAVFGRLEERKRNAFYQALQIDWQYPEGPALFCGGAACFHREALEAAGGFPEDVAYGEEPLLCWRLRNEHGRGIYHLHRRMALHDLAYQGFRDYWRRNVRVGETFAEIATLLRHTEEPLWSAQVRATLQWFAFALLLLILLLILPGLWKAGPVILAAGVVGRKAVQCWRQGRPLAVAVIYALHTYVSKMGAAYGILRWRLRRMLRG